MVTSDRIRIKGLPTLRLRSKASLPDPGQVRALTITKRGRRVFVNLTYEVERTPLAPSSEKVGIDMRDVRSDGAVHGGACGPQSQSFCRSGAGTTAAVTVYRGSRRWRERRAVLANQQHRERVRNRNECHRLTTEIVRRFGLIAVGDLTPAVGQRRTVQEQTWSLLQAQLAYKAEWAGREFVRIDSSHMSVTCSECGVADSPAYGRTRFECF